MRRKISLLVTLIFTAVLGVAHYGCSSGSGEWNDSFQPDLEEPKLKERLAEDDGYAFVVTYGADVHGSLETCG